MGSPPMNGMEKEHDLVEVASTKKDLEVVDGELGVSHMGPTVSMISCLECNEKFDSFQEAEDHVLDNQEHPAARAVEDDDSPWSVISVSERDHSSDMIDLSYGIDDRFSGKVSTRVTEPIKEAGFTVTATHTGIDGVDARVWVSELDN